LLLEPALDGIGLQPRGGADAVQDRGAQLVGGPHVDHQADDEDGEDREQEEVADEAGSQAATEKPRLPEPRAAHGSFWPTASRATATDRTLMAGAPRFVRRP